MLWFKWLLDRSPKCFKALKSLMLRFRDKACRVKLKGALKLTIIY